VVALERCNVDCDSMMKVACEKWCVNNEVTLTRCDTHWSCVCTKVIVHVHTWNSHHSLDTKVVPHVVFQTETVKPYNHFENANKERRHKMDTHE
jgi:hypothetical protein